MHPADGIRAHEEMYEAMARELGKDISKEEPVAFEIENPAFLSAYMKYVHHPLDVYKRQQIIFVNNHAEPLGFKGTGVQNLVSAAAC